MDARGRNAPAESVSTPSGQDPDKGWRRRISRYTRSDFAEEPAGCRSGAESSDRRRRRTRHTTSFLVPQTDKDGVEIAGIRLPDISVPLATYSGWNFRNAALGGTDQLYPLLGSYIPFPSTAARREEAKDPRASIAERYASRQAYLDRFQKEGASW